MPYRSRSRYESRWAPYVPVEVRRRKAAAAMAKLSKSGHPVAPVTIEGRVIARTFWGKAWCDNLEGYHDFENRLPRGRTYVRNGSVVDLQIAPREVTATVSGSSLYQVKVSIEDVPSKQWKSICSDCTGGIDSLVELLQGRFAKGVMERICRQADGLFPKPKEIRFSCSCPDYASMCKHVAAVLYGVGARLDAQPELLFRLRAVDESELVARIDSSAALSRSAPQSDKVLEEADLSALFGLDMEAPSATPESPPAPKAARRAASTPGKPAALGKSVAARPAASPKAAKQGSAAGVGKGAKAVRGSAEAVWTRADIRPSPGGMTRGDKAASSARKRARAKELAPV